MENSVTATMMHGKTRRRILTVGIAVAGLLAGLGIQAVSPAEADTVPPAGTPATVSVDPLPTWQINGVVWSQVLVGSTVYATGSFTKARPPGTATGSPQEVVRNNLIAYDITSGNLVTTFDHSLNAQGLVIMASPDGSRVYVGGDFTTVDGATHNHLVAFDTATGALVTSFNPSVSGQVRGIAATNSTVYVGGNFFNVNGSARTRLAAVTASTGGNIAWTPTANDLVWTMVLAPDGSRVIAGGRFTTLNGVSAYGMGSLQATTGATLPWAANTTIQDAGANGAITSLRTDGTQIYGVGYAFGSGSSFEGVFAANPTTGEINWLTDCHGDTYDAFPIGQVVYNVSHAHDCSPIGAFPDVNPRKWYRALATTAYPTGTNTGPDTYGWNYNGIPAPSLLHWFPSLIAGTYTGQGQAAWTVAANDNYVALGGEFPRVEGVAQQGLVRYAIKPIAPNKIGPRSSSLSAPTATALAGGLVRVAWRATWDPDNNKLTYAVLRDGNPTPVGTVSANSTFWTLPPLGLSEGGLTPGSSHSYAVRATDPLGNSITSPVSNTVTVGSQSPSSYATTVLGDGATSYWRLGETSGTTAYDYAGGNDLTTNSGVTRNVSGALVGDSNAASGFSGTSSGFAVSQTPALPAPPDLSIETWFKTASTQGGKIVGYGSSRTGNSSSYDRHIYLTNDGRLTFGVYSNGAHTIQSSSGFNNNQWHHVVGTLSATNGMRLYVDGALVGSDSATTAGQPFNGYWRVGGDNLNGWPNKPSSNFLKGSIDEVAIYSGVLSASKVTEHYGVGRGTVVPNQPPTAAFTSSCTWLECTFDGSSSSDPDGTISSYAWDFGDSASGSGQSVNHTFPSAGDFTVKLTVTDDDGDSNVVNRIVSVISQTVAADNFSRTVSNGFGIADVGGGWTLSGTSSNFSVDGSAGKIVLPAPATGRAAYLTQATSGGADTTVTVSTDKSGTGNGVYFAIVGRYIASAGRYRAKVRFLASGGVGLSLSRTDSTGAETVIATEQTIAGLAYGPGDNLRVRFQVTGTAPTTLQAKVWADGAAEPVGWQVSNTDATAALQAPGGVGVWSYLAGNATNAPVTLSLDNFSAVRSG
jgi:Concanavalin A-like lectin/glucanases superfamily/PKD domain